MITKNTNCLEHLDYRWHDLKSKYIVKNGNRDKSVWTRDCKAFCDENTNCFSWVLKIGGLRTGRCYLKDLTSTIDDRKNSRNTHVYSGNKTCLEGKKKIFKFSTNYQILTGPSLDQLSDQVVSTSNSQNVLWS